MNIESKALAVINVDTTSPLGKIRRLHGTNMAASLKGRDINPDLKELEIPIVRLHDDELACPGMKLVDISNVFPLFAADHNNPANYNFEPTDDYVADCLATGTKISYRLGESIEWTRKKHYDVHPPKDYEKWAEICCNIIAHYNEGWANGFHHNIEYWPIWEEPDSIPVLWTGTVADYIRLYVITAKKIKQRFPNVKVGGPTMVSPNENCDEFLKACKEQEAPLDFFSWDMYGGDPDAFINEPFARRKMLDEYGFNRTETQVAEWHYIPADNNWQKRGSDLKHRAWLIEKMNGVECSAFICSVLSGWQDTTLDMANYYTGGAFGDWGLFDPLCQTRRKTYYAMKAFNLMTKHENRVAAKLENGDNIRVLAGRKATGETAALVSCFKGGPRKIAISSGSDKITPGRCKVSVLDELHDLSSMDGIEMKNGSIILEKPDGSAVYFVEWI